MFYLILFDLSRHLSSCLLFFAKASLTKAQVGLRVKMFGPLEDASIPCRRKIPCFCSSVLCAAPSLNTRTLNVCPISSR
uniref:Putative secreted protein n=1 Tax=Anopheles triannulatus TaxID=58253 RepID=A0A2M4B232_9DIPT